MGKEVLGMNKLNRNLLIGLIMILLVSTPVVLSFFWMPYDVNEMNYDNILAAPSFSHVFGTDNYGRDIYCRVVEGTRSTFLISIFTVLAGAGIGTLVGAFTGYYGGIVDEILMRLNDSLASFPSILLALVVVSVLDKGTLNICIALGIVFIPSFARIMRAEFMAQSKRDYVANAKLMGAGDLRIIFVHIFPNTVPVLTSSLLVGLNNAVLAEAGLSYLGLGVQPPDPSLGRMLSEAQVYIWGAPWYVISACVTMILMILGITLVSENIGVSAINFRKIRASIEERRCEEAAAFACNKGNDTEEMPVIEVRDLHVGFIEEEGISEVINGISFELGEDEILGIVGESGSGKSMTALSVMGILPDTAGITHGEIYFRGTPIAGLKDSDYCKLRGKNIAMIFQEPMTSLNPVQTVGVQIDEVLDIHAPELTEEEHRRRVLDAMADTGLDDPDALYNMYPHELSGGMRQRVMIAMALVSKADVIIADEPTTALDAGIAGVILDIFKHINTKYGTSIILISHDLEVIARICERALVVKDGRIVEDIDIYEHETDKTDAGSFEQPSTEYGLGLLRAAFADSSYVEENTSDEVLVSLKNFGVYYKNREGGIFGKKTLRQVNRDVDLDIFRGDCLGVVGESGSGKTTLVKAIAGLQKYTSGTMSLNCERPGMVFQDPRSSLNPAKTVEWILEEPLKIATKMTKEERAAEVKKILDAVELDETYSVRRISELSGGQRQRISIALTLILKRDLIILDEPVSALDVTIREQVLKLLMKLKKKYGLTYIIISHDKRLIARVCNRVYTIGSDGRGSLS